MYKLDQYCFFSASCNDISTLENDLNKLPQITQNEIENLIDEKSITAMQHLDSFRDISLNLLSWNLATRGAKIALSHISKISPHSTTEENLNKITYVLFPHYQDLLTGEYESVYQLFKDNIEFQELHNDISEQLHSQLAQVVSQLNLDDPKDESLNLGGEMSKGEL